MPIVDDNRLKGNSALWTVGKLLSDAGCLVRPVAADTDIGIDLYCETVQDKEPFLHFWVQIKSGTSQVVIRENGTASCSVKVDHLKYWLRQPVPVFLFLIPSPDTCEQVYVVDMAIWKHELLLLPNNSKTTKLVSHYLLDPLGNASGMRTFLNGYVPYSHVYWNAAEGMYLPRPTLTPQYTQRVLRNCLGTFSSKVFSQVQKASAWTLIDLLDTNILRQDQPTDLKRFARIVHVLAVCDRHYENCLAMGLYTLKKKDNPRRALCYFSNALEMIESDPELQRTGALVKPPWKTIISQVKKYIQACQNRIGNRKPAETGKPGTDT